MIDRVDGVRNQWLAQNRYNYSEKSGKRTRVSCLRRESIKRHIARVKRKEIIKHSALRVKAREATVLESIPREHGQNERFKIDANPQRRVDLARKRDRVFCDTYYCYYYYIRSGLRMFVAFARVYSPINHRFARRRSNA